MKRRGTEQRKTGSRKYLWSLLLLAALIGITFWLFLKDNDLVQLAEIIKGANPWYILLGFGAMLGFVACEALCVKVIMGSLGQRLPFLRSWKYAFVAFYYSSITPAGSGGQPMQLYHMKRDNLNLSHGSLTILLLVSVYQVAELVYALVMFLLKPAFVLEHTQKISLLFLYGVLFNLAVLSLILCAVFSKKLVPRLLGKAVGLLHRIHLLKDPDKTLASLQEQIAEYQAGAQHIRRHPAVLGKVMLFTMLQLSCQFIVPFFVYKAFGLGEYSLIDMLAVQSVLTLAVGSLPIPGAVGASESGFMILYKIFFSSAQLLPAMMLSRGISFYGMLLVSGAVAAIAQLLRTSRPLRIPNRYARTLSVKQK